VFDGVFDVGKDLRNEKMLIWGDLQKSKKSYENITDVI
jgi:hypothetical protein